MKQESKQSFSLSPRSMEEAHKFAEIFCKSSLCPKHLQGKPGDVIMTLQMGYELGLEPMQAIKTIGVINGIPFAYGDGKLGLVMKSPFFEDMKEWFDEKNAANVIAYCTVKRKGREEVTRWFSMSDAKTAGLLGKTGPWQQYPKRMLQHRARGLALSDTFPDVLFGLVSEDEAKEMAALHEKDITPVTKKGSEGVKQALGIPQKQADIMPTNLNANPAPVIVNQHHAQTIDSTAEPETFNPPELATPEQVSDLHELIIKHGISELIVNRWFKKANATCFEEMSQHEIQSCIDFIINKVAK